ncbi:type II toxin-antitoxin system HipA family toxinoxin YjjJ [Comamonas testosteroni]|uniref:Type II toxin-antitoxin system HipA family toxinoxin YjjJ n=1 Tax=Comamonas testosteroni TaxID=285 RepID=A0A373FSC6_COMTE|nr:type II toxin-antitoxin system HipA family toxin YjjJ [Comamonas testosteroni]RGE47064.1 type II toxin-antitoxin system HipA family toxinoxin YjjJ [Comamonas testosteroni]
MSDIPETPAELLRKLLAAGVCTSKDIGQALQISQPTVSRLLKSMGSEVIRISIQGSIQYGMRDARRASLQSHVSRITREGRLQRIGELVPVLPEGFALLAGQGADNYSEGLPWWLYDMRPQGYLGRAYARQNASRLSLPQRLSDWTDSNVIHALQQSGDDLPGNLLIGEAAEQRFINADVPQPLPLADKLQRYVQLASAAEAGELPGSSAGGEQPKFTAYVQTGEVEGDEVDAAHVIVKFSSAEDNAVSERWRDLLLAEHLALSVLADSGVQAARSRVLDAASQRFLEVERFDRIGALGRVALLSLSALDAEFVGSGGPWYEVTRALIAQDCVVSRAAPAVDLLWAFGTLIGNTDKHNGNLSFTSEKGRPYQLAPAYDMTPMGFAPNSGGAMNNALSAPQIVPAISGDIWRQALAMARRYVQRLQTQEGFSPRFAVCIEATQAHLAAAELRIDRLA